MDLQNAWTLLGTDDVIKATGFLAGMTWAMLETYNKNSHNSIENHNRTHHLLTYPIPTENYNETHPLLTHPLSTLFNSAVYGSLISFGALVVTRWMPKEIIPLVPLALALSVGHYTIKSFC